MARPKEYIDKTIGQRIKLIRLHMRHDDGSKVIQEEFAEHYGVSTQTIRNWENGNRKVPMEIIKDLSETFDIDIDFILGKTDDPKYSSKMKEWDSHFLPDVTSELKFISFVESLGYDANGIEPQIWKETYGEIKEFVIAKFETLKE